MTSEKPIGPFLAGPNGVLLGGAGALPGGGLGPEPGGEPALGRLVDVAEANLASVFYKRLLARLRGFEAGLDREHEAGVRLVSFGQEVTFHVRGLGYHNPSLILFLGETEAGQPVQLIQHVSQISVLLTAVPKQGPEGPRRVFGFGQAFEEGLPWPGDGVG